jgi:mannose-6-phosphate isomerase-like protein (cupin superfamily)
MKYVYSKAEAKTITKFGVDITLYETDAPSNIVYEQVEVGHLQEWYSDKSTYQWFIIEGKGTYVINDEKHSVEAGDLVVVPPNNRMHYFGKMKMLLVTTPAYDETNEHEVRLIDPSEALEL